MWDNLFFIGLALMSVGMLAFVEELTKPEPDDPALDEDWFRRHEAELWRAMKCVSEDARNGRYQK